MGPRDAFLSCPRGELIARISPVEAFLSLQEKGQSWFPEHLPVGGPSSGETWLRPPPSAFVSLP
jgi:hypothetical protein